MRRIYLFLTILVFSSAVQAQTTSSTSNPDWAANADWTGTAPQYTTNQDAVLNHSSTLTGRPVNIGSGLIFTINVGKTLSTDDKFTVKSNATLIINGTLNGTGGEDFEIKEDANVTIGSSGVINWDGDFEIKEDVTMTVEGTLIIGGDFEVKEDVNLVVNGNIQVLGEMDVKEDAVISGTGGILVSTDFDNDGTVFGCVSGDDNCCGAPYCTLGTYALPVELTNFSASHYESSVLLEWATASEKNNDFFEILRSANGLTYEIIGQIDGGGNSSQLLVYEFVDENPLLGTSYYKLRQTDFDGENEEFGPKVVNFVKENIEGQCELLVYPNPCPGNCRAKLSECPEGSAEIKLMMTDATGHIVNEVYPIRNFDGSFDIQIDVNNNLKPGVYIITAQTGEERFSQKAIIN